jgi:hypothetical protein
LTERAWRAVCLIACALVLVMLILGAHVPSTLALVAAYVQVGGAGVIALIWLHRQAARSMVFFLLFLAVWAAWAGTVSSLAISAALALFVVVVNLFGRPISILRRVFTVGVFAFDTIAVAFLLLPPPDAWRWANLVALDVGVVICCFLAVASSRDRRWLAVPIVLPVMALAAAMALEEACALLGCLSTTVATLEFLQAAIGIMVPIGLAMGLSALPENR